MVEAQPAHDPLGEAQRASPRGARAAGETALCQAEEAVGDAGEPSREVGGDVPAVAAEHLVATVAVEDDRDVLPGQAGQRQARDGAGVGERLVVVLDHRVQALQRVELEREHRRPDAQRLSGAARDVRLVEPAAGRHGEGVHGVAEDLRGLVGDDRAVHTTAQEDPERHVAAQPEPHRVGHELADPLVRVVGRRVLAAEPRPPPAVAPYALGAHHDVAARLHGVHALEDRVGLRDDAQ